MPYVVMNRGIMGTYPLSSLLMLLSPSPVAFLFMLAVQVLTERAVWLPGIETVDKGFFNYNQKEERTYGTS